MVIRRAWANAVRKLEPVVTAQAAQLAEDVGCRGDARAVAERLGACVESIDVATTRKGWLQRRGDQWVVRVYGDVADGLDAEQQLIVAHELAHVLMIEAGVGVGPCSDAEYWLLEETCDRVAGRLLRQGCDLCMPAAVPARDGWR